MLALYECAACILAVLVGATLLFGVCVMVILSIEGSRVMARTWQELTLGAARMIGRWMVVQPREP
jgi:hypothetical protein